MGRTRIVRTGQAFGINSSSTRPLQKTIGAHLFVYSGLTGGQAGARLYPSYSSPRTKAFERAGLTLGVKFTPLTAESRGTINGAREREKWVRVWFANSIGSLI